MRKRVLAIVCLCAMSISLIGSNAALAFAATPVAEENVQLRDDFYPGEAGEIYTFKSIDENPVPMTRSSYHYGDEIYSSTHKDELGMAVYTDVAYYISEMKILQKFVKYLTSSWSKSSSYTWSKTNTTTITGSGEGAWILQRR